MLNRKTKTPKAVNLVKTECLPNRPSEQSSPEHIPETDKAHDVYNPFLMNSFVSISKQGPKVPVTILRDSGASQSMLLEGVLPLSTVSSIGCTALVRRIRMKFIGVPLHAINLESDFVSGRVVVRVMSGFHPGERLGGGVILLSPEVIAVSVVELPDELKRKFPDVFPVCAVTRAMAVKEGQEMAGDDIIVD